MCVVCVLRHPLSPSPPPPPLSSLSSSFLANRSSSCPRMRLEISSASGAVLDAACRTLSSTRGAGSCCAALGCVRVQPKQSVLACKAFSEGGERESVCV